MLEPPNFPPLNQVPVPRLCINSVQYVISLIAQNYMPLADRCAIAFDVPDTRFLAPIG